MNRLNEGQLDNYIPEIVNECFGFVLVQLNKCPICEKQMLFVPKDSYDLFPKFWKRSIKEQMQRAEWVQMSSAMQFDKYVCVECSQAGKVIFSCSLCDEKKYSSKIQESFGWPPEHLCTDCYGSIPAKEWEEKVHKLKEIHLYDFE